MPQTDTGVLEYIYSVDPTVIKNEAPAFMYQPQFSAKLCQKIQKEQKKPSPAHLKGQVHVQFDKRILKPQRSQKRFGQVSKRDCKRGHAK